MYTPERVYIPLGDRLNKAHFVSVKISGVSKRTDFRGSQNLKIKKSGNPGNPKSEIGNPKSGNPEIGNPKSEIPEIGNPKSPEMDVPGMKFVQDLRHGQKNIACRVIALEKISMLINI